MLRTISGWASRHVPTAIVLITLLELVNGSTGALLGANLLAGFPAGALQGCIIALVGLIIYIRLWYLSTDSVPGIRRQRVKRLCMFALFFGNFMLFAIAGGIGANRVRIFHPSGSVAGSTASVSPVVVGDSLKPAGADTQPKPVQLVKLRRKIPLAVLIAGCVLLLGAGVFLGVLLIALSCELACTGYGLGAVLLTLLGLGAVGTLSFLWGRVLTNNLIRMKEPADRSRASRRYRRVWLATVLGLLAAQVFVAV